MVNLPAVFTCCVSVTLPFNERTTRVGANVCRVITLHYARLIPYGNFFVVLYIVFWLALAKAMRIGGCCIP